MKGYDSPVVVKGTIPAKYSPPKITLLSKTIKLTNDSSKTVLLTAKGSGIKNNSGFYLSSVSRGTAVTASSNGGETTITYTPGANPTKDQKINVYFT